MPPARDAGEPLKKERDSGQKMKVLVLSPPTSATQNVVRDLIYGCWCKGKRIAGAKSPPTNLLYVATMLKQQGHDVRLLDATAEYKTAEIGRASCRERG